MNLAICVNAYKTEFKNLDLSLSLSLFDKTICSSVGRSDDHYFKDVTKTLPNLWKSITIGDFDQSF